MVKRATCIAFAALSSVSWTVGCGARTDLDVDARDADDGGAGGAAGVGPGPCAAAGCADITRGTFRLTTAAGADFGFLFLFDASGSCGGTPTHYFITLSTANGTCSRNSDIVVTAVDEDTLSASADNHGGSVEPECGGEPFDESVTLRLVREPCDADRYALSLVDSEPASPFTLDAVAERCRCDIGWQPCEEPLPDDPCAPLP